jgi:hypothetical protein
MVQWPKVTIKTYFATGEQIVTYDKTPEELIKELREAGEYIYVTKGSCSECHYTPERLMPNEAMQKKTQHEVLPYHRTVECIRGAIARVQRRQGVPDNLICYGFYYQYWHENSYLRAAKEADLIRFYDISEIPALHETHLKIYPDYFF